MNTVYICTQGTSIANRCEGLAELQRADPDHRPLPWGHREPKFEQLVKAKLDGLDATGLRSASAELKVLSMKGAKRGDRVVLLCSDSYLGDVCGRFLQESISRCLDLDESDVEIRRVADLQVHDGERLSTFGLKNFIDEARKTIEAFSGQYEICLCPNGGYKGAVPFLTILGMLYHCSVFYTFEFAESLVTLPPLPFTFDCSAYGRARKALATLTNEVEMPEGKYLSLIDGYQEDERDLFLGFVQHTRIGFVTPSPLVDSLVQRTMVREAMLSKQALEDLEREKKGKDYFKWCRFILNSQDPVWCKGHLHSLNESPFQCLKRTGKSTQRLLGFMRHGRFYITRAVQHDEYESAMWKGRPEDYADSDFQRWEPPSELDEVGDDLCPESELQAKNDELLLSRNALQEKMDGIEAERDALAERLETADKARRSAETECQELKTANERLADELAKARSEVTACKAQLDVCRQREETLAIALARAQLPWYRRLFGRNKEMK